MELLTIPNTSFVDFTGRKIGVYSNKNDWWKNVNSKKSKLSTDKSSEFESSTSMHAKLIEKDLKSKKKSASSTSSFVQENGISVIGETLLHIAITYDDLDSIKILIEKKSFDVNKRTSGEKLLNGFGSKETLHLIKNAKYDGLAYYGEYPLALAAYFENKNIYDYLLENGADPNLQGI